MAATNKNKRARAQEVLSSDEYLKKVLAAIPEAEQEEILSRLGEHVLRQDEFSRLSDEATTREQQAAAAKQQFESKYGETVAYREKLDEWWKEKTKEAATVSTPTDFDPTKYLTKDEAARAVASARSESEQQGLALTAALTKIGLQHLHTFGEVLDTNALIDHARKIGQPIDRAWEDMTRPQREVKLAEAATAHEAKLRADIEKDIRSKLGPSLVYPQSTEPSTLAGLGAADKKDFGIAAAVRAIQSGEVKFG